MSDSVPEPRVEPLRRTIIERFSIVWVVPIAALLISLGIAWQSYSERGPTITIGFDNASGIEAGETELRFRDVTVGLVEDVRFSDGLDTVVVEVRIENEVAPYVDTGSEFWVVRPQVTAQGVSGLDTVLSGAFIEGSWDNNPEGLERTFVGLPAPPIARPDVEGLSIILRSVSGDSLVDGTPILYRGVRVGRIANLRLAEDGVAVLADAFIEAPHDELVTSTTRFWDTSGFAFSLGPRGATLDVSSLAALVSGGVAFNSLVAGGEPVPPGTVFELYSDRDAAQASVFTDPETGAQVPVSIIFSGNADGLTAGSPVELRGVRVGEVTAITGYVDEERFGDRSVRLLATAEVRPDRLGVPDDAGAEDAYAFLAELVDAGLRAQLARGSLLTGGLKVSLEDVEGAAPAELDFDAEPYPVLPSVPVDLPEVAATAEALIRRVSALPIESLLDSAVSLLDDLDALIDSPAIQQAPADVAAIVGDLRRLLASEAVQDLPDQASGILLALEGTATELQAVLQQVQAAETVETLTAALASAGEATETVAGVAATVQPAAEEATALISRLNALSDEVAALLGDAAALPLEQLVADVTGTVSAVRALVDNPEIQAVPASVTSTLAELEATLAELRQSALVETATDALASADRVAESVAAATDVLPALAARLDALIATVNEVAQTATALPLQQLVTDTTETVGAVRALVDNPEIQAVPVAVASTLTELEAALAELRQSALVETATDALASADRAADALAEATTELPALVARLSDLAARATALAQTAEDLPLQQLVTEATSLVQTARSLVDSAEIPRVTTELADALAGLDAALTDVQETDLIATADQTLTAAAQAASAVALATEDVPELIDRIGTVAATLESVAATAQALPLQELVGEAAAAAAAVRTLVASPELQEVPADLSATLAELEGAISDLRQADLAAQASATLSSANAAADALATATAGLPELVGQLQALAETANALPLGPAVQSATDLIATVEELVGTEAAAQLPAAITTTLQELRATVAQLRTSEVIATATETLASAGRAADAVSEATEGVPVLIEDLSDLADTANALPLEQLVTQATAAAEAARAILAAEGAEQLPASLNSALAELDASLAQLREGGIVETANQAIANAGEAAEAVATATEGLPELVAQLDQLAQQSQATLAVYGEQGTLSREARAALREVRDAANSISSLARAIERNPNSLLLGR